MFQKIILTILSIVLVVAIQAGPYEFLAHSKYITYFLANIATNNMIRCDPYNDELSYGFHLFIHLLVIFNKSFLLNFLFFGSLPWERDGQFINIVGLSIVFHALLSKFVIPHTLYTRTVKNNWVAYIVSVGDKIAQTGPVLFMMAKIYTEGAHIDNELILYLYVAQIGLAINLVVLRDFELPIYKCFKILLVPFLVNLVIYLPPYYYFKYHYQAQKDQKLFLHTVVVCWFVISQSVYFINKIPVTPKKQVVPPKIKKE